MNHFLAGDPERHGPPVSAADEDGVVAFGGALDKSGGDGLPAVDIDPHVDDAGNLGLQGVFGQPVPGDAPPEDAPRLAVGLEYVTGMPQPGQKIGRGESGGTGAGNRDVFSADRPPLGFGFVSVKWVGQGISMFDGHVADGPLQGMDADGTVHLAAVADPLARMKADPPADGREGVFPENGFPRCRKHAATHQHFDAGDVFSGRTGAAARRRFFIVSRPNETPGAGLVDLSRDVRARYQHRCFAPGFRIISHIFCPQNLTSA